MRIIRLIVRTISLVGVTAAFFCLPWTWLAAKPQRFLWAVAISLVFGRFFCDSMCPLGILQTLVNWLCRRKDHVRRVCTRLPVTRTQRIVRIAIAVLTFGGMALGVGVCGLLAPMSIYGKALSLWWPGLVLLAAVLMLSAFGEGRVWCNWVCPFGTVFHYCAKIAPLRNRVGKRCGKCRKCFGGKGVVEVKAEEGEGITRRETLKGVAVLAAAEKLTDGGFAEVTLPGAPKRERPVLPPGAGSLRNFASKCEGCQLCVTNCPGKCLKPSTSLSRFGQPELDFRHGYCLAGCVRCVEVCPERALGFLQVEQRVNVHQGVAVWEKSRCVRCGADGDDCTACVRKCPVQAIHLVEGFPVVDGEKCIGCGACEHVCPARPLPAIWVKGYEKQRVVNPIDEAELKAEMKSLIDAGKAVVAARDGVIVASAEGHGLKPLMELYDSGRLQRAVVMDRVVGRAAAAVCVAGGVRKVCAPLSSKGAVELLARHGVALEAASTVETILDRERKGDCPMEKAVADQDDPQQMVETLRKAMQR